MHVVLLHGISTLNTAARYLRVVGVFGVQTNCWEVRSCCGAGREEAHTLGALYNTQRVVEAIIMHAA